MAKSVPKVVVMGGGTGTFPVISALKRLEVDLTSIIAVSDSGGSTGRIRDEFGFQPVGDLRQSLAALAENSSQEWIRKILLYRFKKGGGLSGHNLGNLILTALQDMTGSTSEALRITEEVFRLEGTVIPVTEENVNLKITLKNGSILVGEHLLDDDTQVSEEIKEVSLTPAAAINPAAADAIVAADLIIIGPGDYYASLMATLVAHGTKATFKKSKAKLVYLVNLMTRFTQTKNMSAREHIEGIERVLDRKLDYIIVNSEPIPQAVLDHYAQSKEHPVEFDISDDTRVIKAPLISSVEYSKEYTDNTHRSVLRHDSSKVLTVLKNILER